MEIRVIEELPDLAGCRQRARAFAASVGCEAVYSLLSYRVVFGGLKYMFTPWGDEVYQMSYTDGVPLELCLG